MNSPAHAVRAKPGGAPGAAFAEVQGMRGYERADGRIGIRDYVVVAYLVECAHHVARRIVDPYADRGVQLIGFPGCYPSATASRRRFSSRRESA